MRRVPLELPGPGPVQLLSFSLAARYRFSPAACAGCYGGTVDGDRTQLLLVDLGGVLFSFDHEHRLDVLGECLGLGFVNLMWTHRSTLIWPHLGACAAGVVAL